ncbi:MAG: glycoside hydrolase family 9 protein [Nostocaceae cyanobacterium]|nr:glycoside hydrolase family 9 protein [Nostocaceae cyanobacterium]
MNTVQFFRSEDWGIGFTGNINIQIDNTGESVTSGWTLEFEAPFEITDIWGAEIVNQEGNLYTVRGTSTISSGNSISFGFNASISDDTTTVEPSNYLFNGASIEILTLPGLSISDVMAIPGNQGITYANFQVQLAQASDDTVTVQYATSDSTAKAGSDYEATAGVLTFAPGETSKIITVPVLGDVIQEVDESFAIQLFNPRSATLIDGYAIGVIVDEQPLPQASPVIPQAVSTPDQPSVKFVVTNDWDGVFLEEVSVTNNGTTAIEGWNLEFDADFEIPPEAIWNAQIVKQQGNRYTISNADWNGTIAAGETVSFGFQGNNTLGAIAVPSNYLLNGESTQAVSLPQISINDVTLSESNSSTNNVFNFEVQLSQASSDTVTVAYSTKDGTATAGLDYTATSGTLTFAPGETAKMITVSSLDDSTQEVTEGFVIHLSNPQGVSLADGQGVGSILDDESFNYGEALQKSFLFYEAQRSGPLPEDNRIEWRGDSALRDGADVGVDLTGGYHDAGDHLKLGFPMAASMTMLAWGVDEYRQGYEQSGQLDEALDAIKWGTDYILKAHITDANGTKEFWAQVGLTELDHAYWGPAEEMTMERPALKIDRENPGSDLAAEAAAALAAASIVFRPTDSAYADLLLENAKQLYTFADTYRGKYSDSIADVNNLYTSTIYEDELAWGAMWLYKATGEESYLTKAEQNYSGTWVQGTQSWENKQNGTAILLAQETNKAVYRDDVQEWLNYWTDNSGSGITYTEGGLAWFSQWSSLRYAANTAFLAGVYSDTVTNPEGRYSNFAEDQIDYILGDNPRNFSYMVGFGSNFPLRPHHASAHDGDWITFESLEPNANILYGALVGGPASADDNSYVDDRTNFFTNEVALDYNAAFTGSLARMYQNFGGDPLTDSQLDSLPGIQIPGINVPGGE